MSILVFSDAQTASTAAATLVAGQLIEKPSSVLGFGCDEALAPAFQSLQAMTVNGLLHWGKATVFQLSERVWEEGVEHLRIAMGRALFDELSLDEEKLIFPAGASEDWAASCHGFEEAILNAGGMDMALLSVQPDGSVLFNTADGEIAPTTHVELYGGKKYVTAGITTLMSSKKLVVLMVGPEMAEMARQTIRGAVNTAVPASLLQLHDAVTFLLDEEAASLLG